VAGKKFRGRYRQRQKTDRTTPLPASIGKMITDVTKEME
jgi:hypothetical protein